MRYAALRDEISNDPLGRGYDTMSDAEVAEDLNTNQRQYERPSVRGPEIYNAIVPSEWSALLDTDKRRVRDIFLQSGGIDVSTGSNARKVLADVFDSTTTTRTNLKDVVQDTRSRAKELGLPHIYGYHVEHARKQLG